MVVAENTPADAAAAPPFSVGDELKDLLRDHAAKMEKELARCLGELERVSSMSSKAASVAEENKLLKEAWQEHAEGIGLDLARRATELEAVQAKAT